MKTLDYCAGFFFLIIFTIAILGVVFVKVLTPEEKAILTQRFQPPKVSESDTLRGPIGTIVIYYMDGTMNAGVDYYHPRVEGTWIVFESKETIRVVPVFNVLEVYWFEKDSIENDPYHQQNPITPVFPFPPTPQLEGT